MGGGGGGGGGGMVNYNAIVAPGGGGGQGQSVVLKEISVPSGATIPVTVGAGGAGGVLVRLFIRDALLFPRGMLALTEEAPLWQFCFCCRRRWRENWHYNK